MAEAVLFDFGGTLDADGEPWCERFYSGYRAAGGRLSLPAFEEWYVVSDRMLARAAGVRGFGFGKLVMSQVDLLAELLPDGSVANKSLWAGRFILEARVAAIRNRILLRGLQQRFALGVISNFSGNLRPCLEELELDDCFDVVFDSAEVGVRKPDARLFRAAFDALGLAPEECWMVGDNPFADILPAARLGCPTCWLAPAQRPTPPGVRPTRRIAALTELPEALQQPCTL